ncbi:MAG: TetR/AcrR family transcriptional regulator [Candidatus Limnocylindria bacterium]
MKRAGVTAARVVEVASELIEEDGPGSLTLAQVAARLGVKTPSLYSHIQGIEALRRAVALAAIDDLGEACRTAAMGKAGPDALRAVAFAYRSVAATRTGTYSLTQVARPGDDEWEAAGRRVLDPILAAMEGMGITGDEAIHATRYLRSAVHGFVSLESGGGFGLAVSVEDSFARLVDATIAGIEGLASE